MIERLTRDEGGWVLVTAAVLMGVMLSIGLLAMQLMDVSSHRSREQRETESALNVGEGVLYAQSLALAQNWPSNANHPYAVPHCDSAVLAGGGASAQMKVACPNPDTLAGSGTGASFSNVDQVGATRWKTKVRDNGGALVSAYDAAKADAPQMDPVKGTCPAPCNYDFNGDKQIWVQAQAFVRGHPRNVVARMQLETLIESTPRSALTAGALSVTNSGNHGGTPIIDGGDSEVIVRCTNSGRRCVDAEPGQIVPAARSGNPPNLMTPDQLARLRQRAITDGRYYSGCPGGAGSTTPGGPTEYERGFDLSGPVVWVEGCSSPPTLTNRVLTGACSPPRGMSTACINTESSPGLLIWHCGRADFTGAFTYRGMLYLANNSDGTCPTSLPQRGDFTCTSQTAIDESRDVLTTSGGFGVWGAVAVDGPGCAKFGSNNLQLTYDSRVFEAAQSYGTVGLVQNTWRELDPNAF